MAELVLGRTRMNRVIEHDYPTRKRIRLPRIVYRQGHIIFLTITTHQRHNWFRLYPALCLQAVELLNKLTSDRASTLYAWCILPDHMHLLINDQDMVEYVRLLKGRLTPVARRLAPKKKLWQRSFYDHFLRKEEAVYQVAQYIWENPVRAGLVELPQHYKWSGSSTWPDFKDWYESGRG